MDEVENNLAVPENAAPETSPQESTPVAEAPVESQEDKNWREMRRVNKELERKLKMQEETMNLLLAQKAQPAPQVEVDELDSVPADDYIPKGQVEKLVAKKAAKVAQEAVHKALKERETADFHNRLKGRFSDFDEVVTPETLELLEQQDPELAKTILEVGDPYKMGLQTYKFIKSMGLAEKAPMHRRTKEVEKKMEQNAKTVQSPQAYDKRPMAQTFQMTEAMKQDLFKEMNQYASLAGSVPGM